MYKRQLELSLERIHLLVDEVGDHDKALIALRIAQELAPENPELLRWHEMLSGEEEHTEPSTAAEGASALESSEELGDERLTEVIREAAELTAAGEWEAALALLAPYDDIRCGSELLWLHVEAALGAGQARHAISLLPRIAEIAQSEGDTLSLIHI